MNKVIFAGGCFWCVEHDLHEAEGVINVISGYTGGESNNPTYENPEGQKRVLHLLWGLAITKA
jgi:peptide-methionine (S)-S-oxide reductase